MKVAFFISMIGHALVAATPFETIASLFEKAQNVNYESLRGQWYSGRCFHWNYPDEPSNSLLWVEENFSEYGPAIIKRTFGSYTYSIGGAQYFDRGFGPQSKAWQGFHREMRLQYRTYPESQSISGVLSLKFPDGRVDALKSDPDSGHIYSLSKTPENVVRQVCYYFVRVKPE